MKDFCKWLGVNEKVAKIVVWIGIVMIFLIMTNAMLESVGFPYYKLTVDNLSKISINKMVEYILSWILCLLNFYSVVFLIFKFKDFKKIFKYSLIYLVIGIFVNTIFDYAIAQVFIICYILTFCYLFSNKSLKYVLYGLIAYILNIFIQYICYMYKVRFIDFNNISYINKFLTSFDSLILMWIMIVIKEKLIKRRVK